MAQQYPPATGLANWRKEYTDQFIIEAADLRTLNSIPITLVTPPTATSIVVPLYAFQMSKAGGVAFSDSFFPTLVIGNLLITQNFFQILGTASIAGFVDTTTDLANHDFVSDAGVGAPMMLSSTVDVTDGDGTVLTLEITYAFRELAGLI